MKKIGIIFFAFFITAIVISIKLITILNDDNISTVAAQKGTYTINSTSQYAGIYDCNMNLFVNCSEKYEAVIIPNHISAIQIQPYIINKEIYYNNIKNHFPFLCEVKEEITKSNINVIVIKTSIRNDCNQLAPHIIGYSQNNIGICGIEKTYNDFLKQNNAINSVTFQVDALGKVLNGIKADVVISETTNAGIITTLDKNIQQICEDAFTDNNIEKGAIIIMDVKTGEIKANVSFPDFDINNLEKYINDSDSPFINRTLSAYSVGSIFKLITSAAALEQGISSDFTYTCTGSINVNGQIFNCHKWGGHGEINMSEAMVQSCNTYFIALSEYLNKDKYINLASELGFGKDIILCDDIYSVSGILPNTTDITIPAERANMSFGQGILSATPLQICRMTAAIANNGVINTPTLIKGIRTNDNKIIYNDIISGERVLSYTTSTKLKSFMFKTVYSDNSLSKPDKTTAAGKTSTAQTGWFYENGTEIYNCWFTGYFPSHNPKYAVTVLIEGGISGNKNAGPIFKTIVDNITTYEKSL